MAKYICNGVQCKCTMGTKDGALDVKSQTKIFIQDKLMATENEKSFVFPNFTSCKIQNPPIPCQPAIEAPWSSTKNNVLQSEHKGLLEASTAFCTFGQGEISILDSKQSDTKNVIFGDYSSEPKEISKVYAKVRTLEDYDGEFGFDWVDVNPETMEIQKIQGVPFSDAEYFYKKGNSPQDLGDIIPVSQDTAGTIQAIKENYDLINFCDYVDTPFVLLKPGENATLSLEVFFEGESHDDYISITGDEFYSFKIDGEEERKDENDKTTKKKIVANEQLQLTINCSKESLGKKYFFLHTGAKGPREIGGLSMMENKELKLKFRVIALVSNEGNPNEKAKALFKKFKNAGVKNYLNNNSLNQAGYAIEIENFDAMDAVDVDDYFYAFDKKDWENKKYYKLENNTEMLFYNIDVDSGKKNEQGEPIMITKSIDYTTIEEYYKKSKYKGGLIILGDGKSMNSDAGAFSRPDPLNHYTLFVYNSNTGSKDTYAHEISHMLGLPHLFYHIKEKDTYQSTKYNILGNGEPEQIDGKKNPKNIPGILKTIEKTKDTNKDYYSHTNLTGIKKDLLNSLDNLIKKFESISDKNKEDKRTVKAKYINYPDSYKINSSQTKAQYIAVCDTWINLAIKLIGENNLAKENLSNQRDLGYITLNLVGNFLKKDYLKLLNQNLEYYNLVINQMNSNYIMFKQSSTENMMDYYNNEKRFFFMHNQIMIMRNDIQNYL
ncbi:MAG: DUF4280 domain-containing protein [Flavobacterium sp.]